MVDQWFFGESERSVYEEEQSHLDRVERKIDSMIDARQRKVDDLDERLKGWHAVDYDDADLRRSLGRDRARKADEIDNLLTYKGDPYFCRFEVSVGGGEPKSYCVGERPLTDLGDIVVLDWRSPLGHTYANKTQRQFRVASPESGHEYTYDLHLRRLVDIKNARIVEVTTEYDDVAAVSLDGEIVDPFLLSVLRDKRRNFRLSGIIKTIQAMQNSILERPVGESFIVQGCAGSGKTMILLHRLSYLAFNHPEVDFSKYIVLTPSESFNAHIDDLCDQLDLDHVMRLTVESFYARIVTQLSRFDAFYEFDSKGRKGRTLAKITASSEGLTPEERLGENFLRTVYSEGFLEDVSECFMALTDRVYGCLDDDGVLRLFDAYGFEPLDIESSPYDVYRTLSLRCERLRRSYSEAMRFADERKAAHESAAAEFERARVSYQSAVDVLDPLRLRIVASYVDRMASDSRRLDAANLAYDKLVEMLADAGKRREILSEEVARWEADCASAQAELASAEAGALLAEGVPIEDNPEIAGRVAEACQTEADKVARLKREYDKVGVFNLGRRRRLREELERATMEYENAKSIAFEAIAEDSLREAEAERAARIERLGIRVAALAKELAGGRARLDEVSTHFDELSAKMNELVPVRESLEAFVNAVGPLVAEFEASRYPMFSKAVNVDEIRRLAPEIADYIDASRLLAASQKHSLELGEAHLAMLERRSSSAWEDYLEAAAALVPEEDQAALSRAEELCEMLDVRVFESAINELISEISQKEGAALGRGVRYRHGLYAKAVLCLFYYGPPADVGACVCIDEAQDLSPAEHSLIRSSLGPDAVVNLYGDLNQRVCGYKGIASWDEVDEGRLMTRYALRENYRNTIQVTNYCNDTLDMDITGVGLTGPEVTTCSLEEAVERLVFLHEKHEGIRCAVIYAAQARSYVEREGCLTSSPMEWGVISSEGIAVISVEASKGLEFDAVVVVDAEMSRNEKYVAFTRTVELLMLVEMEDSAIDDAADGSAIPDDLAEYAVSEQIDGKDSNDSNSTRSSTEETYRLSNPTLAYRANTKCVRHEGKISGPAYAGTLPVSGDTARYMCESCHDTVVPLDVARSDFSGVETAGFTYSITITPEVDNEQLRFLLLEGKRGGWYLTGEHEYTSPTYRNMKWHRRLSKIAEFCPAGKMHVLEGDYDGQIVGEADFEWTTPDEFAQIDTDCIRRAIHAKES